MRQMKLVVVGDPEVGKTNLLVSYTTNSFPGKNCPKIFDNYPVEVKINNEPCTLDLIDTAGQGDVVNPISFANVAQKWVPEIKHHCPNVPIVLIGTQCDLLDDEEACEHARSVAAGMNPNDFRDTIISKNPTSRKHRNSKLIHEGKESETDEESIIDGPIDLELGAVLAHKVGAVAYFECSALTQKNIKKAFDHAVIITTTKSANERRKRHRRKHRCIIL